MSVTTLHCRSTLGKHAVRVILPCTKFFKACFQEIQVIDLSKDLCQKHSLMPISDAMCWIFSATSGNVLKG